MPSMMLHFNEWQTDWLINTNQIHTYMSVFYNPIIITESWFTHEPAYQSGGVSNFLMPYKVMCNIEQWFSIFLIFRLIIIHLIHPWDISFFRVGRYSISLTLSRSIIGVMKFHGNSWKCKWNSWKSVHWTQYNEKMPYISLKVQLYSSVGGLFWTLRTKKVVGQFGTRTIG